MAPSAVTIGLELDVPLPTEPFVLSILAAATAAVWYPSEIPRSRLSGRRRYAWPRGQSLPPSPQVPLDGLLTRSVCSCMLQRCSVFFHHPQRARNPPPTDDWAGRRCRPTSSASPATSTTIRPPLCLPILLCETSRPNPNILFVFGSESNFKCICMYYAY